MSATTTTALGRWLRRELNRNGLTQNEAAVYAGVASATLSEILNKGHVPKLAGRGIPAGARRMETGGRRADSPVPATGRAAPGADGGRGARPGCR